MFSHEIFDKFKELKYRNRKETEKPKRTKEGLSCAVNLKYTGPNFVKFTMYLNWYNCAVLVLISSKTTSSSFP